MGTELLLTGLFILLVLGLLVAFVYSMTFIHDYARMNEALGTNTTGQQRFFSASILNYLNQK